jgi:hypothetical protein
MTVQTPIEPRLVPASAGVGTVINATQERSGKLRKTRIFIDLTGSPDTQISTHPALPVLPRTSRNRCRKQRAVDAVA